MKYLQTLVHTGFKSTYLTKLEKDKLHADAEAKLLTTKHVQTTRVGQVGVTEGWLRCEG